MTKMRTSHTTLVSLAVIGAVAFLATPVAQALTPFDWSGFYIGVNVGEGFSNYDFGAHHTNVDVEQQFFQFEGPLVRQDPESRASRVVPQEPIGGPSVLLFNAPAFDNGYDGSVVGGTQFGYQKQFGHFVFGLESDFTGMSHESRWSEFSQFQSTDFFFDGVSATTHFLSRREAETHWNSSGRGKVGFATGPLLFYVTGGVVLTDLTVRSHETANTDFFLSGDIEGSRFIGSIRTRNFLKDEDVLVGWTGGGGFEYLVTQICSMGVEYRHNGFGGHTYHSSNSDGPVFTRDTQVNSDSDQIVFKVNFLLGHLGQ
jgi:outer membrane immunogenic protein